MRCKKCNGYLFYETERSEGIKIEYFRCINCGARYYNGQEQNKEIKTTKCALCGKEIHYKTVKIKYCPECKKKLRKKSRICQRCGKEFTGHERTKYCPDCRHTVLSILSTQKRKKEENK